MARPSAPPGRNSAIAQSAIALALLVGLPIAVDPPASTGGLLAAGGLALVLLAVLAHGVSRFVKSRHRAYPDSMLPPEIERRPRKHDQP